MNAPLQQSIMYDLFAPTWWQNPLILAAITALILLGIAIGAIGFWFYRKWRSVPFHEHVIRNLKHLKNMSLDSQEDQKKLYDAVTQLIKAYILMQFQCNSEALTEEELIQCLTVHQITPELITSLIPVLQQAVMSKFAQEYLDSASIRNQLQILIDCIESYHRSLELQNKSA